MNIPAHAAGFYRWLRLVRRYGWPERLFYFDGGLGDQLLCSSFARELQKRRAQNIWLFTQVPELFEGNGDFRAVLPYDLWLIPWLRMSGTLVQRVSYQDSNLEGDSPLNEHVIASLCRRAGVSGQIKLRAYLPAVSPAPSSSRSRPLVAVQSSCLSARYPMANKQWPVDRFQQVIDQLKSQVDFIQIGSVTDPPLHGAEDRRGTGNLLDAARFLAQCDLFVGLVGFLMHLARAVECPAVIVYGGREVPEITGYSCNLNITHRPPCSPCWSYSRCDYERRCLTSITVPMVIEAIGRQLTAPAARPLHEEHAVILAA